jgi:hypothetical protein
MAPYNASSVRVLQLSLTSERLNEVPLFAVANGVREVLEIAHGRRHPDWHQPAVRSIEARRCSIGHVCCGRVGASARMRSFFMAGFTIIAVARQGEIDSVPVRKKAVLESSSP